MKEDIKQAIKRMEEVRDKNIHTFVDELTIVLNELERLQKEFELENALNFEKTVHTCLHCGNDTPLYCEKCYQELISKNAELQLQNEKLKTLANKTQWISPCYVSENYIPKQVIRDKIQLLEKELKLLDKNDKHTLIENDYIISVLKEILGE